MLQAFADICITPATAGSDMSVPSHCLLQDELPDRGIARVQLMESGGIASVAEDPGKTAVVNAGIGPSLVGGDAAAPEARAGERGDAAAAPAGAPLPSAAPPTAAPAEAVDAQQQQAAMQRQSADAKQRAQRPKRRPHAHQPQQWRCVWCSAVHANGC
jgi:hypothetical protein